MVEGKRGQNTILHARFPMYMRGYAMRTGKSIGVLDELYCRALCLRTGGETFVWMTLDLCRLEEISSYIRRGWSGQILCSRGTYYSFHHPPTRVGCEL